jgi:nitrogen-specific signal transduction histidine kinase
MEAGKLDIEPIPFDAHTVAGDVIDLLLPAAEAKALELVVRIDPGLPRHVVGDPGRIRQVMLNLVSNAIKFTERGHVLIEMTGRVLETDAALRIAANAMEGDREECLAAGMDDYLSKPVVMASLASALQRYAADRLVAKQLES